MRNLAKKAIALLVAGVLTMGLVTGCGVDNEATVAKVGDVEISLGVANFYARYQQSMYETYYSSYYGDAMWSTEIEEGKTMEADVKEHTMESIQNLYLMDAHAKDYSIALTDDENAAIDKAVAKFMKKNDKSVLRKISGDEEIVKEVFRLLTLESKVYEAMIADVNREVSDDEAAQKLMGYASFAYSSTDAEGNTVDLTDEQKADLKKKAEEFLKKAKKTKKAEDLEALAKEYGVTWTKDTAFDAESTSPAAEVVKAVDKIKKEGKFASLIETETGLYVAQLISKFDRKATDSKKDEIISERENERYEALLKEWREATTITVDEKAWAQVDFDDISVLMKVEEQK